ncbi:mitotic-spindle organizing gamma-tubulin ring associated-domain-containing protein [Colletotrichum navitas]|uniref:Mitotic-spindle organizing protein 1 n=1 Tax=Colletotrichum navitas TaxID=681940 RepID=A0AAD8QAU9_9PEZI|nr:mitotic-spindle organizing gamma-tubulin ring associated-domain-containing protein [Colletotrichum navitas]KAK1597599.1 mitotic-spindle organizing gamma-tubulin ring associated-domain-containing protein [Colletotrichum navitas]
MEPHSSLSIPSAYRFSVSLYCLSIPPSDTIPNATPKLNHKNHPYEMPADDRSGKQAAAQQAVDILHEISTILNCHLDRRTLSICISMIENGVNPEALASVVKELRKESQEVDAQIASRRR